MVQAKSIGIAAGKVLTPPMGLPIGFHIQNNLGHGCRLWHGHGRKIDLLNFSLNLNLRVSLVKEVLIMLFGDLAL